MKPKGAELSTAVKKVQIALTLIGMSGIVLSFVSFTFDQIPFDTLLVEPGLNELWSLVAPCILLPVAVIIGYAIWLIMGQLPRWLVIANYAFAVLSACTSLAGLSGSGYETELITMILLFVIAFASAAWLSVQGIAHNSEIRSLVAMQGVYVVPMAFWVAFAQVDFQIGAWLGAVTLLAYSAQIAMAVKSRWLVLAIIIPIVSIISLMTITWQFW